MFLKPATKLEKLEDTEHREFKITLIIPQDSLYTVQYKKSELELACITPYDPFLAAW